MTTNGNIAVTSTATEIDAVPAAHISDRVAYVLQNIGSVNVYVGDENVTSSNGLQIDAGSNIVTPTMASGDKLYVITASGSSNLRFLRNG